MSKTSTNLFEALMPLKQYLDENRMDPARIRISLAPEDYERLLLILSNDSSVFNRVDPMFSSSAPVRYLGLTIGANFDNRIPARADAGDD
jgi:hypothetical protein